MRLAWEFCEVWWTPTTLTITVFREREQPQRWHSSESLLTLTATLRQDGWKLAQVFYPAEGLHDYGLLWRRALRAPEPLSTPALTQPVS